MAIGAIGSPAHVLTNEKIEGKDKAVVNVYIFGPINAFGLNFELSYNSDLIISNDSVTINTNFTVGGNAAAGYNVDNKNDKITFSWIEGNGKTIAADTYVKVMSLSFSIDSKLQSGLYEINLNNALDKTYLVNDDLLTINPEIVSGGIKIN